MPQNISEPKLITAIRESLRSKLMHESLPDALLTKGRSRLINRSEHAYWDYKRELPLGNEIAVARFAKDILGFHNADGGVLIVGVTDDGALSGLASTQVKDATALRQLAERYVGKNFPLFFDVINLPQSRVLWLIFINSREKGLPKASLRDGPITGQNGQREVRKGGLYLRDGDQIRTCSSPDDYGKAYSGYSLAELEAYTYEVDEPYLRLLKPDSDVFVGRRDTIVKIDAALALRHPIIALDGLGGVGKTATAIHVLKQYAAENRYEFIVSLSAKHKLWHNDETHSRRASFVGLSDFLREVATVLDVPYTPDIGELEIKVVDAMRGYKGLLLLDNLEEIDDHDLLAFISERIPEPVKTIVTTRIDKSLGAYTISIPQLDDDEAAELFCGRLAEKDFSIDPRREAASVRQILEVTGRLPLALIWAARVVLRTGSIERALEELGKFTSAKNRFLEFCFHTMWSSLSVNAQQIAMLRGYLGERCTQSVCGLIMENLTERELLSGIIELSDSGLLTSPTHSDSLRVLSLTRDFMLKKWKDNASFQRLAQPRIAEADENMAGALLEDTPSAERVTAMIARALELSLEGKQTRARRVIDLVLRETSAPSARFLAGRIRHAQGERNNGLLLMSQNIDGDTGVSDRLYFARALRDRGTDEDLRLALSVAEPLIRDERPGTEAQSIAIDCALRTQAFASLYRLLDEITDDAVVAAALREMPASLVDDGFLSRWGPAFLGSIERVEEWTQDRAEKTLMRNAARNVRLIYSNL